MTHKIVHFETLLGETLTSVKSSNDDEKILIKCASGRKFEIFHQQDCCENVRLEDVCGDLEDLVGSPIILAEEISNPPNSPEVVAASYTWTFYRLGTIRGACTFRWLGTSDGCYSERVTTYEVLP